MRTESDHRRGSRGGVAAGDALILPLRLWGRGAADALELSSRRSDDRGIGIPDRYLSLPSVTGTLFCLYAI
jgi:hypothetical protein